VLKKPAAQIAHLVFANTQMPTQEKPKELFLANAQPKTQEKKLTLQIE